MSQQPGFNNYGEPQGSQPQPPPFPQPPHEVSADTSAEGVSYDSSYAQQQAYPQNPGYAQPQQGYAPPPTGANGAFVSEEKNWMGIVAIVGAFFFPLMGVIFGHMGLAAAKKGEASNRTLALVGLILSYVFIGIGLLSFVLLFIIGMSSATVTTY